MLIFNEDHGKFNLEVHLMFESMGLTSVVDVFIAVLDSVLGKMGSGKENKLYLECEALS
jgi:hypothetical protein